MLSKKELTTAEQLAILAGLRVLQFDLERGRGVDVDLTPDELDELCERINCGALVHDPSREEVPEVDGALLSPDIEAETWPDGRPFVIDFHANRYFAQADGEDIRQLAAADWAHDEPADWVAEFTARFDQRVQRVFDYLEVADKGGFECAVDGECAMAWLKQHRQGVWALIVCDRNDLRLVQAQEPEVAGRWDWVCDDRGEASDASFETEGEAALDAVERLGLDWGGGH